MRISQSSGGGRKRAGLLGKIGQATTEELRRLASNLEDGDTKKTVQDLITEREAEEAAARARQESQE